MEGYRNFCNKLWNAARYVLMNTEEQDCGIQGETVELTLPDRWIISRLQETEAQIAKHFAEYRFDLVASTLYEFVWNEYCDWYLELSKPVLWDESAPTERLRGTRRTLVRVLEAILRLAHPLMPYITEEIWQRIAPLAGKQGDTIMLQAYPLAEDSKIDTQANADIEWLKAVMLAIRNIRGEMNLSPGKAIPVWLGNASTEDQRRLEATRPLLTKLAKLERIELLDSQQEAPMSATALVGQMEILVPMAGIIDKEAELSRLSKELENSTRRSADWMASCLTRGLSARHPRKSWRKSAPSWQKCNQPIPALKNSTALLLQSNPDQDIQRQGRRVCKKHRNSSLPV